ncbi:MAG: hypothetical protein M0R03_15640 [Novosphingobium sp.]|nr:hypothetical protein [Novosphingobium sp.]
MEKIIEKISVHIVDYTVARHIGGSAENKSIIIELTEEQQQKLITGENVYVAGITPIYKEA